MKTIALPKPRKTYSRSRPSWVLLKDQPELRRSEALVRPCEETDEDHFGVGGAVEEVVILKWWGGMVVRRRRRREAVGLRRRGRIEGRRGMSAVLMRRMVNIPRLVGSLGMLGLVMTWVVGSLRV